MNTQVLYKYKCFCPLPPKLFTCVPDPTSIQKDTTESPNIRDRLNHEGKESMTDPGQCKHTNSQTEVCLYWLMVILFITMCKKNKDKENVSQMFSKMTHFFQIGVRRAKLSIAAANLNGTKWLQCRIIVVLIWGHIKYILRCCIIQTLNVHIHITKQFSGGLHLIHADNLSELRPCKWTSMVAVIHF